MFSGLPIQLAESPHQGRYIIATDNLSKKHSLLSVPPYALGIFDAHKKRICPFCLAQSSAPFPLSCSKCDQIYVCSAACYTKLLVSGHHLVCRVYRKLATHKAPLHEKSVLKMLVSVLTQRAFQSGMFLNDCVPLFYTSFVNRDSAIHLNEQNSYDKVSNSIQLNTKEECVECHSQFCAKDKLSSSYTNEEKSTLFIEKQLKLKENFLQEENLIQKEDPFIPVASLQSNLHHWSPQKHATYQKTHHFIHDLLQQTPLLLPHESSTHVLHLISKIESNCFGVYNEKGVCMGRGMYPLASYFNHSCEPNCHVIQEKGRVDVQTLVDIKKGEECTISYIDTSLAVRVRRGKLQEEYFFKCVCGKCVAESGEGNARIKIKKAERKRNQG